MAFEEWYINGLKVIFVNDDSLLPFGVYRMQLTSVGDFLNETSISLFIFSQSDHAYLPSFDLSTG